MKQKYIKKTCNLHKTRWIPMVTCAPESETWKEDFRNIFFLLFFFSSNSGDIFWDARLQMLNFWTNSKPFLDWLLKLNEEIKLLLNRKKNTDSNKKF